MIKELRMKWKTQSRLEARELRKWRNLVKEIKLKLVMLCLVEDVSYIERNTDSGNDFYVYIDTNNCFFHISRYKTSNNQSMYRAFNTYNNVESGNFYTDNVNVALKKISKWIDDETKGTAV